MSNESIIDVIAKVLKDANIRYKRYGNKSVKKITVSENIVCVTLRACNTYTKIDVMDRELEITEKTIAFGNKVITFEAPFCKVELLYAGDIKVRNSEDSISIDAGLSTLTFDFIRR